MAKLQEDNNIGKEILFKLKNLESKSKEQQKTLDDQSWRINGVVKNIEERATGEVINAVRSEQTYSSTDSESLPDANEVEDSAVASEEEGTVDGEEDDEEGEAGSDHQKTKETISCESPVGIKDESTELLFIIDSNARYLNFRKLWTMKGTEIFRCGTMFDVYNSLKAVDKEYTNLKYFFLSIGTNDLEVKTPHELFTNINTLIRKLNEIYPNLKFIISEVTPRMDHIDERVKEANVLLHQYAQGHDNIFLVKNKNLRNPDYFFPDGKHLKHEIIPRFANNIKRGLRAAYGIHFDRNQSTRTEYRRVHQNNPSRNDQSHQHYSSNDSVLNLLQKELLNRITRAFEYLGT